VSAVANTPSRRYEPDQVRRVYSQRVGSTAPRVDEYHALVLCGCKAIMLERVVGKRVRGAFDKKKVIRGCLAQTLC
jgi:hypothetical protein